MPVPKILYKVIYIFRKKMMALQVKYVLSEYQCLYSGRFYFQGKLQITEVPNFDFDLSGSKIIIKDNFVARGKVNFLFHENGIINIGTNIFFNRNCSINCLQEVRIGDNCLFGENVKVYDHNHKYSDPFELIRNQGYNTSPVVIGNNCWIGSNAVILKGVTIGDNSIIGANCTIFKDIPANSVVISKNNNQISSLEIRDKR